VEPYIQSDPALDTDSYDRTGVVAATQLRL